MADETVVEARTLVPGRSCSSCNICCVALTIDDPAMRKVQGYRCRNALRDNSCAIYDSRPQTCRSFECGWRQLPWVRETLRPDRSGVLVRLHYEVARATGERSLGIIVTLLNRAALKAEGLAETVAAAVAAGLPVFLEIPGRPGYTSGMARLNEALGDAVLARDKAGLLQILRRGYAQGQSGESRLVTFADPPV